MPFYHGSASTLYEDEILYPGDEVGLSWYGRSKHVYMTHTGFSMSELNYIPSGIESADQYAVYSAALWGCWAADVYCDDQCEWAADHSEALASAMIPECVKVYEVTPLGPVTADTANDVDADACCTTQAQILRTLDDREIAALLNW